MTRATSRNPQSQRAEPPGEARPLRDPQLLADAIRRQLPSLGADDARRHGRTLDNILQSRDSARQAPMLRMLAANVIRAVHAQRAANGASPAWQTLSRTTVGVRFRDAVVLLSKAKEAELMELQAQIRLLAPEAVARYQASLREALSNRDLSQRETHLRRLRKEVAQALSEN